MKVVTDDNVIAAASAITLPPGIMRLYNKLDGSTVDVHAIDGKEYIKALPHIWSSTPVAKEQAEDAVIVQEPVKEEVKPVAPEVVAEPAPIVEEKPVSARSRRLAKLED